MKVKEIVFNEAVLQQIKPGISAQIKDPEKGITYDIDLTKPGNIGALTPDEQGGLSFDPTPQPGGPGLQAGGMGATGPKPGMEVNIKADEDTEEDELADASDHDIIHWANQMGLEDSVVLDGEGGLVNREEMVDLLRQIGESNNDVGGDATDDFINDVEDKEYGQQNESDIDRIKKLSGL